MDDSSTGFTTHRSLGLFFKDQVENAIRAQQLEASEEVEFYLVNLLDAFSKTDTIRLSLDEPFALLLHKAVFSGGQEQMAAFRRLGDISLYVAGLFAPSLRRRSVDVNYAIRMGAGAYASVAALVRYRSNTVAKSIHPMYVEMSHKFAGLVEVLTQVGEQTTLGADSPDLAELYERWSRTKGPHLAKRMQEIGVMPMDGSGEWS